MYLTSFHYRLPVKHVNARPVTTTRQLCRKQMYLGICSNNVHRTHSTQEQNSSKRLSFGHTVSILLFLLHVVSPLCGLTHSSAAKQWYLYPSPPLYLPFAHSSNKHEAVQQFLLRTELLTSNHSLLIQSTRFDPLGSKYIEYPIVAIKGTRKTST